MDGLGPGGLGCLDDVAHLKVALGRRRWTDADRLICRADGQGVGVFGGIDRDRLHTQLPSGAHDAQRYLAPIRNEYLLEHPACSGGMVLA